jgi:hypothetical protein
MSEHLKFVGRRQELELKKRSLEIRIHGLIKNLRDDLDPLKPVSELRTDAVAELAVMLAETKDRYMEVLDGLKQIKDILG